MFVHVFVQAAQMSWSAGEDMKFWDRHDRRAAALREDSLAWVPESSPKSEAWLDSGREDVGYLPRSNKGVPVVLVVGLLLCCL